MNLQILALLTILSLAQSIINNDNGFLSALWWVLPFTRSALALQQTPPNQVVIGLALFLTFHYGAHLARGERASPPTLPGWGIPGMKRFFSAAAEPVKRVYV